MSAQGYATFQSIPFPLAHSGGGTSTLRAFLLAPLKVVWSDSVTDTYAAGAACVSIYDGTSTTVDGSTAVYLVVAVHGASALQLAKEADYTNLPTLVTTGEWAVYARIDGDIAYRMPQV